MNLAKFVKALLEHPEDQALIPEKLILKVLEVPIFPDYDPKDATLKKIKVWAEIFISSEHPRHEKLKIAYRNVLNVMLKVCDRDPHYRARLITLIIHFQGVGFPISDLDQKWAEAFLSRYYFQDDSAREQKARKP